jgi:hypothetical protein
MPLHSETTVTHADPASVVITVEDVPEVDAHVNVHVVVNPRFALVMGQAHDPEPTSVTQTTVSWVNFSISQSGQQKFVVSLAQNPEAESSCSAVSVFVDGTDSNGHHASFTGSPTVCFP